MTLTETLGTRLNDVAFDNTIINCDTEKTHLYHVSNVRINRVVVLATGALSASWSQGTIVVQSKT